MVSSGVGGVSANAGRRANVVPDDRPGDDVLAGVGLQRRCGRAAFAAGGGAKSPVWRQIKADILNAELLPTLAEEAGALGSAILGLAAATGEKDRTALAARFVRYGEASRPDAERHAYYQKQYQLYKDLREFEVRHVKG